MTRSLGVRANLQPWSHEVEFAVVAQDGRKCYLADPVVMSEVPEGSNYCPAFTLGSKEVQQLMDDLWRCGFRPSEGTGSAGQLAAVQTHLEDMRKIAFGALNKEGLVDGK